ncbi:hypothetical protein LCGC14_1188010, partial [marine sediment metagenome]
MGCDIHLFSEVKRNGKWEPAVPFVLSEWWYETIIDDEVCNYGTDEYRTRKKQLQDMSQEEFTENYGDDPRVCWEYYLDRALGQRNYCFFAILADVRNGRGFAGISTGDGFNPIAEPRGVPEDASMEVKRENDYWNCDGHSHSYLTLKELLKYDWEQVTVHRGIISEKEYARMLGTNSSTPMNWCGKTYGPDIEQICLSDMYDLIKGKFRRDPNKEYVTEFEWEETYREAVGA